MIFLGYKEVVYAKVWSVTKTEKYIDLRVTTSEKDKEGNYVNSTWFPRLVGKAFNSLKDIKVGDAIILTKCKLSNESKEDEEGNKKSFFRFVVFEASFNENTNRSISPQAAPAASFNDPPFPERKQNYQPKAYEGDPWEEQ
jgi:hypothetical protein